jgi:quercetin dioxygenase-like cupin family protein
MRTANLNTLTLLEGWYESNPTTRQKAAFPFYKATGAESLSVVYFEIEPGNNLGEHTDSAEEVIIILEGSAEANVGDERGLLSKGEMALIPAMTPHDIRNVGSDSLKVVGFFPSSSITSTFSEPIMPLQQKVVGTPPIESSLPLEWNDIVKRF